MYYYHTLYESSRGPMNEDTETGKTSADIALPMPPWAEPRTRRARAARQPLDRERIVAAGLRIVDEDGVDAFSLRRLADSLGVSPMSIYWHVADKAELVRLIGEAVLDEVQIPEPRGDWREQLRDVHRSLLWTVIRHPNTTDIVIGRARFGAAGLTLFERILSILLHAGFSPEAAFDAYQSLYLFTLGFSAVAGRSTEFRAIQRQGLEYMRALPEDRFPSIRTVVPAIGGRDLEAQFEIGFDVVIEGIAARLPRSIDE